jgi:hypothetical protein
MKKKPTDELPWSMDDDEKQRLLREAIEKQKDDPNAVKARAATDLAAEAIRLRNPGLENSWRRLLGKRGTSRHEQAHEVIQGIEGWLQGVDEWTEEHALRVARLVFDAIHEKPLLAAMIGEGEVEDVATKFLEQNAPAPPHMILRAALVALSCDPEAAKGATKKHRQ